jgi:hypothetical protein
MKVFVFISFLSWAAATVVVFVPHSDTLCSFPLYVPERKFMPVFDREQGFDPTVTSTFYSGNPPASAGNWTSITATSVTLCHATSGCTSFPVWPARNNSDCRFVSSFGYGHFYQHTGPAVLALFRTTGPTNEFTYTMCTNPSDYKWTAYAHTQIDNSTAPCTTSATDPQWYWDGGDKLVWFKRDFPVWTKTHPCGAAPYPGEKCFSAGTGYCMKNTNCAVDYMNAPATYPFASAKSTTIKVVTENRVDFVPGVTPAGSAAALLAPSVALLVAAFALLH